jgi:serine/threonine protein kinase
MTLQQIDNLCDEFEAALRKGETIRIEDVLPKIDEEQRSTLLQELLEVEIQFAIEHPLSDDSPKNTQESLKRRFPDSTELIQSLFQRFAKLRQIGDYEILGELGRGGMGVVYKAKHKLLQQTVAIKVLSQALLDDSQAVGRFKREMQLIGGLTHPNVVRALNAGESDGMHYLAMEFVEGLTLQKLVEYIRVKDNGVLPIIALGAACEAIRQSALGLQNAHDLKLIHRDIKPANLMIDYHGTVKILDLGLGKFAEERRNDYHSSLTVPGMVLGTVDYISPEQCENSGEADIRSDLYSLGCSLYFLLTGKPVYSGSKYDTMRKKLMAHIVGEVPSLRQTIPNLPKEIEAILQKTLAKDPAERFQTPIEFAEALEPFASPEELWTVMGGIMPADIAATRSGMRHSNSPYASHQSKKNLAAPANRPNWTPHLLSLCLLCVLAALGTTLYFAGVFNDQKRKIRIEQEEIRIEQEKQLALATQAEEKAQQFWKQWKMAEARNELQKALTIRMQQFVRTQDEDDRKKVAQVRLDLVMAHWYCGDTQRARRELQVSLDFIGDNLKLDAQLETTVAPFRMRIQERLGDFRLFGGAASGITTPGQTRTDWYEEATKTGTNNPREKVIRWKQTILLLLNNEFDRAKMLMERNPLPNDADMEFKLVHQLAEAILFYYQNSDERAGDYVAAPDRNQKLRAFQSQFSLQSNSIRELAAQPEILELLLLCAEFVVNNLRNQEDWETLADVISSASIGTSLFLRQYPDAAPFMRRYYELFLCSSASVYEKLEQPKAKQKQIGNIVQFLDRMRPVEGESAGATLVFFFLPEPTRRAEESFVVFAPQDGREEGALHRLPLTRTKAKQREQREPATVSPSVLPELPPQLLEQIATEKAAGRKVRISWDDSPVWSSADSALTDKDYPYGDVLPLR